MFLIFLRSALQSVSGQAVRICWAARTFATVQYTLIIFLHNFFVKYFLPGSSDAISSHSANFSTTAFADPSGEFRGSPNTSEPILPSSGERMDSLKHNSSSDRSSQSYSPEKNSYSMDTQDSQVIQQQNQQQEEKINTMDMTTSEHDTKLSGDSAHNSLFDPISSLESSENNSLSLEMPLDLPDKKSIQHHVTQTPDAQATESNLQMSGERMYNSLPVSLPKL